MKIHTLLSLGLILLTSCNSIGHKPIYGDFKNDLDRENLYGKVMRIEKSKTLFSDPKTTDNPIKELVMEFSQTGNLLKMEKYDVFGKLTYLTQNIYNKQGFKNKAITEDFINASKSVEEYEYKGANVSLAKVFVNDTLKYTSYFEYDKNGHLTKQLEIQKDDTTLNRLTYMLDKQGSILSMKNIQTNKNGRFEYVNTYKYDNKNNMVEINSNLDIFGTSKVLNVYDLKGRIEKSTHYKDKLIEKNILYDKFYNETLISFFRNGTLERELKYEYEFDAKGNWTKREAFVKNNSIPGEDFKMAFTETREIKYYN